MRLYCRDVYILIVIIKENEEEEDWDRQQKEFTDKILFTKYRLHFLHTAHNLKAKQKINK